MIRNLARSALAGAALTTGLAALALAVPALAVPVLALTATPAQAAGATWTENDGAGNGGNDGCPTACPGNPPNRASGTLGYDPATSQTVLFGGYTSTGGFHFLQDTWLWNGSTWSEPTLTDPSPPASGDDSMTYDSSTSQLLLYVGGESSGDVSELWAWDGSNWSEVSASGPPARNGAGMAYDPDTNQVVLFGGYGTGAGTLNDTWTWNGSTWSHPTTVTMPADQYPAMAYDPATSQLMMFSGTTFTTTVYLWSGTNWSTLSPSPSPDGRESASMAYDAGLGEMVLFGGRDGSGAVNDTWGWDGSSWTNLDPDTSPASRYLAMYGYDATDSEMVLFGGFGGQDYNDTWTFAAPSGLPGAPANVSAEAGDGSADVTFDAPTEGGGAITGYTVTATDTTNSDATPVTATGSSSPITVPGLTNGDEYTFTVTATNDAGTGDPSDPSGPITIGLAPGAPTGVAATAGFESASVTFTAPDSDGGLPIVFYTATATDTTNAADGGQTGSSSGGPISVDGLVDGDAYTFTVTAINEIGPGSASDPSAAVTPAVVPPAAPAEVSALGGDAQAVVAFAPPPTDGGSTITGYTVTAVDATTPANGSEQQHGSESPITVTGLTNGDSYTFTVTASNSAGASAASVASNAVIPATTPSAPVISSHSTGDGEVSVGWSAPASGGSAITYYVVTATPAVGTAATVAVPSGQTSTSVTGLTNGTAYTVTVTAFNGAGGGAASGGVTLTPATSPAAPAGLVASPQPGAVALSWGVPASNGEPITSYLVTPYVGATAQTSVTVIAPATETIVSGLTDGVTYTFTVTASNSGGTSAPSNPSAPATPSRAAPVVGVKVTVPAVVFGHEQSEKLVVTVSGAFAVPTGGVTVTAGKTVVCHLATLSSGSGQCTVAKALLHAGKISLVASYTGDGTYLPGKSPATTMTVKKAKSTTLLKLSTTKVVAGKEELAKISVTIKPQFAGIPTGKVLIAAGRLTLCKITLAKGAGTCLLTASELRPGNYVVIADYPGDGNFLSSRSKTTKLMVAK